MLMLSQPLYSKDKVMQQFKAHVLVAIWEMKWNPAVWQESAME